MTIKQNLDGLSKDQIIELIKLADERKDYLKYNKIHSYYPDTGSFSRDKYPGLMTLMKKGKDHLIRALFGANGSGKTTWGCVETYYHLSGKYPHWWTGRKFKEPVKAWIVGREGKQMRAAIQDLMFGSYNDQGSGIFPKADIIDDNGQLTTRALQGTSEAIGTVQVRHYDSDGKFDGWSSAEFKNASQGWQEFQGSTRQWIWIDEEPDDEKVYSECLARTRGPKGKEGSVLLTFTPLLGYTKIYLSFLPGGRMPPDGVNPNNPQKFSIVIDDNQPHLTEEWRQSMAVEWKLTDPLSVKARKTGLASIGVGRIYPIDEDFVVIPSFKVPDHWPRAFGMDFGWHNTACIWIAKDPLTKIYYIYDEYKRGEQIPEIHTMSIKSRGDWIPGICDPSKGGRNADGSLTMDIFMQQGLRLFTGENGIKSGITKVGSAFELGKLKIMSHCTKLLEEVRMYKFDDRDIDSPSRNQEDHLLDALKYDFCSFDYYAKSVYDMEDQNNNDQDIQFTGRSSITGY